MKMDSLLLLNLLFFWEVLLVNLLNLWSPSRRPTRSSAVWSSPTRKPTRGTRSWRSWLQPTTATLRSATTCAKAPRCSLTPTTPHHTHAHAVGNVLLLLYFFFLSHGGLQTRWFMFVHFCFPLLSSTTTWQKSCWSSRTNAATSFLLARPSEMNYLSLYFSLLLCIWLMCVVVASAGQGVAVGHSPVFIHRLSNEFKGFSVRQWELMKAWIWR